MSARRAPVRPVTPTLPQALWAAARAHGGALPIVEEAQGAALSYRDLLRAACALGRHFAGMTRAGENVGVLLPNAPGALALMFGLQHWGRVPALLNYASGPEPMRGACSLAQVRRLVTSRRFVDAAKLEAHLAGLEGVNISYLEDVRAGLGRAARLRAAWDAWRGVSGVRRGADDPAFVLFTSGSEDSPKGVVLSHRAVLANVRQMSTAFPFGRGDKFLSVLPMYHSYGLTACTLMPLLSGTPLCFYTNPLHYHVIPQIVRERGCRVLFGTSTFLARYARHASREDFATLRYVISGGESLDPEVAAAWRAQYGLTIYEGYGCTECAPVITLNTPTAHRAGSIGRPLPGIEYRLRPVPGIASGGELHVRGDNVMLGYYLSKQPGVLQPAASSEGAGWHNTGDIIETDGDGYLRFAGRLKRFAKIAGEMVQLDFVEDLARRASPEHQHAAVVERVNSGESTLLYTTDSALTRARLVQIARDTGIGERVVARRIAYLAELPRLGSGKADYVTLARDAPRNEAPDLAAAAGS